MQFSEKEIYYTVIAGGALMVFLSCLIVLAIVKYNQKLHLHIKERARIQHNYEQELLRTQLEIQEQTFKTISQEIHDNIGQMLSLAKLNLNRIDISKTERIEEKINDAKELVSKSIQELRDLSKTLNTEAIASIGLLKAIEAELQLLQKTDTVKTTLRISGNPIKLDPQKELILFRITQEALHNIIKHASASSIDIMATFDAHYFVLSVVDDGNGFDSTLIDSSGSGLRNMKSRAQLIGATWKMESNCENGTSIQIHLPLSNEL